MPFDRVSFLNGGECSQLGYFAGSTPRGLTRFKSVFLVLEHPAHGVSLIDTGYSPLFFDATRPFPQRLYRWTLPVHLDAQGDAGAILSTRGIAPVREIFISHFHGDHVAGLQHFPQARFVYRHAAHAALMHQSPLKQTCHGFLPALLPDDFAQRGNGVDEDEFLPGNSAFRDLRVADYWGDGDLLLVDLPGHAPGHTGFAIRTAHAQFFYIADACWDRDAMLAGRPLPLVSRWLQESIDAYADTQERLRRFAAANAEWEMLACHCPRTQAHANLS
jgi:glyoxylase-like metal-dependent hydrolase (beta-lactamase superfamily II)